MKKLLWIFSIVGILILAGCGDANKESIDSNTTDDNVTILTMMPPQEGAAASVVGSVVVFGLKNIAVGALGKVGGVYMGKLLETMGYADDQVDYSEQLDEMEAMLEEIIGQLTSIETSIANLENTIYTLYNQTLTAINLPDDEFDYIDNSQDLFDVLINFDAANENISLSELAEFNTSKQSLKLKIKGIHNAIVAQNVLESLTDSLTLSDSKDETKQYEALELLTTKLVSKRIQALNLIAQMDNYENKNETLNKYIEDIFKPDLLEEIDNPKISGSFIRNVWTLALYYANPLPYAYGSNYFTQDTLNFLSRAEYYRTQLSQKEFKGIHLQLFVTKDITTPPSTITVSTKEGIQYDLICKIVAEDIVGPEYDYWFDGNNINSNSHYDAYECFSDTQEIQTGTYHILDSSYTSNNYEVRHQVSMKVKRYNDKYQQDNNGDIVYGYGAGIIRSPMNHFRVSSSNWGMHHSGDDTYSTARQLWPSRLTGYATTKKDDNFHYDGIYRISGDFFYNEDLNPPNASGYNAPDPNFPESKKITVRWLVRFKFDLKADDDLITTSKSSIRNTIGVWNHTDDKYASSDCENKYNKKNYQTNTDGDVKYKKSSTNSCFFIAEKGKKYYIYIKSHIYGYSDSKYGASATSSIDDVPYVYIDF